MTDTINSGGVVTAFLKALNDEDFAAARQYVTDDLQFVGVMGTRDGADVYFEDMKKMKFKYNIKRIFADGDDAAVFYDINMGGKTIFSSGWYHLHDGKIHSFEVIFDPRSLLDK